MPPDRSGAGAVLKVPFNDLGRADRANAAAAVQSVIERGWYLLGDETTGFEREFAAYIGAAEAVCVASGTDALGLALAALGAQAGDEVVTAANAGGYTTTAARQRGIEVRYADVDERDLLLSAETVETALTPATKVVVVTHLYGRMAPVQQIRELCHARGIAVLEDCAQAAGARASGGSAGSIGDAAAFSFYPTKNLGALGDAGAVVTSRAEVAERVRRLRQYGWGTKYRVVEPGGQNSRIDELQAAVLRTRLPGLQAANDRRRAISARYAQALAGTPMRMLHSVGADYVAHLAVLMTPRRESVREALGERGIAIDIHYPVPDHRQQVGGAPGVSLPVTERAADEVLSVPCFPELEDAEVDAVCDALQDVAGGLA